MLLMHSNSQTIYQQENGWKSMSDLHFILLSYDILIDPTAIWSIHIS